MESRTTVSDEGGGSWPLLLADAKGACEDVPPGFGCFEADDSSAAFAIAIALASSTSPSSTSLVAALVGVGAPFKLH